MGSQFFLAILGFVLTVGILVTVHEFGHFWVARKAGVKVLRFSIGFGKVLLRWKDKLDTEYVLSMIPLGGYVQMLDGRVKPVPSDLKKYSLDAQSVWKKMAIVLAGPLANFIFSILVYGILYSIGISGIKAWVGSVDPGTPAMMAGFKSGESIIRLNGQSTPTWNRLETELLNAYADKSDLNFEVTSNGSSVLGYRRIPFSEIKTASSQDLPSAIGISRRLPPINPILGEILTNSPADAAGLKSGDKIIKMDDKLVTDWIQVVSYVQANPQKIIRLHIERNGETLQLELIPASKMGPHNIEIGTIGASHIPILWPEEYRYVEQYPLIEAFSKGAGKTLEISILTLKFLWMGITGELSANAIGGPISIAKGAGDTLGAGFVSFLSFLALFSISLGLLNLLPIPLLDGGHFVFYLTEAVMGKPLPEKVEQFGIRLGFLILIAITAVAFYNDLS